MPTTFKSTTRPRLLRKITTGIGEIEVDIRAIDPIGEALRALGMTGHAALKLKNPNEIGEGRREFTK